MVKAKARDCGGSFHHNLFFFSMHKLCILAFALVLVGCGEDKGQTRNCESILEVNGVSYSQQDLARELAFREALVRICRPKTNLEKARPYIARGLTNEIIAATLFLTAAQRDSIQEPESITNRVLSKYRKTFVRGKGKTLADFENLLAEEDIIDIYTNNLRREIAREAYLEAVHSNDLRVTESDIDNFLHRISNYNAMVAETNRLAYAKATNLWTRIKTGEDFASLADKESEDPDRQPGGELGECEKIDFELNPGYWETVSKLKAGEVSGVLTTDVGIEIVKALTTLAPSEDTGAPALKLSRIYIRRAMSHPEWSREETKQELETEFRKEVLKTAFSEVLSNATIIVNGEVINAPLNAQTKDSETPKKERLK